MNHLELADIAKLLGESSPIAEACRHLAEVCPVCGERLAHVEALMQRIGHWDPEVAVREGLEADDLLAALLTEGSDLATWSSHVERTPEYQTWGVAWVALERAQTLMADAATRTEARALALLAAVIAEKLASSYHPEWIADLKALAYSTAVALPAPGEELSVTLRQVTAAVTALDKGTGDEAIANRVLRFLSQALQTLSSSTLSDYATSPLSS